MTLVKHQEVWKKDKTVLLYRFLMYKRHLNIKLEDSDLENKNKAEQYLLLWRANVLHTRVLLYSIAKSWLMLCEPIDCSHQPPLSMGLPTQEYWSGLPFLGVFPPRDPTRVSCIERWILYHWATREAQYFIQHLMILIKKKNDSVNTNIRN